MIGVLAAGATDTGVAVGAGALVVTLFGYLLKELRRKDEGVWAIIADRDRTHAAATAERDKRIAELVKERDFWRDRVLQDEDDALQEAVEEHHRRRRQEEP